MTSKVKIVEFKAVSLWEGMILFFVLIFFVLGITEYVIVPLTKGNSMMQTQLIIFSGTLLLALEYAFYFKRAKDLYIEIDELENITKITYSDKSIFNDIRNINTVKFLFKKTLSYTLIINNTLFLIYKKEAVLAKSDKKKIKAEMENLMKIIGKSKFPKNSPFNIIPKLINISFYLLLIISFSLFVFLFIAIFTDNTRWFDYFK